MNHHKTCSVSRAVFGIPLAAALVGFAGYSFMPGVGGRSLPE